MISSISKDEVVGKVLQVLGVECTAIRYEESKKGGQFMVSPMTKDETVQLSVCVDKFIPTPSAR